MPVCCVRSTSRESVDMYGVVCGGVEGSVEGADVTGADVDGADVSGAAAKMCTP